MGAGPLRRGTLARKVELPASPGVISRRDVRVSVEPASPGSGIMIRRSDLQAQWPADIAHVIPSRNCTTVGEGEAAVSFIEHLMACLCAGAISDAVIVTDGPEIPLYDGSAALIWQRLQQAGRRETDEPWEPLVVRQAQQVADGPAHVDAAAADSLRLSYELQHPHPLIGHEVAEFGWGDDFGAQLAPARTFATDADIRALYGIDPTPEIEAACLIVYSDRLSQEPPLAQPFARHKLLDLMGDLFLCGRIVQGRVQAVGTGHRHNHALVRLLLEQAG